MSMQRKATISLAAMAMLINLAMATNYTVGAPNGGWDLSTDLQTWAASNKFTVGDILVFQYTPNHDVVELTKADYDSCTTTSPLDSHVSSPTIVPLTAPGKRYFACGITGHCSQGMKVEIDTLAAAAPSTAPSTPPPTASPAIPSAPPTDSPVTPPVSSPPPKTPTPRLHVPASAPALSPESESKSPASSPASPPSILKSPVVSSADTPTVSLPPQPHSAATKVNMLAGSTMGFTFVLIMILAL